jgi:MoaA/NifB/PqqE/SkfB family radical SAM enzyme
MSLKKLVIELTNACNLDCEYCFKKAGTSYLDIALLQRLLEEARSWGASKVTYTGGEVSLHPRFDDVLHRTQALDYRYAVVTNGWHFSRLLPPLIQTRGALKHIFFSLDSVSEPQHDKVRGKGSYTRVMRAAGSCVEHKLPFSFLVVVNQRNYHEMKSLGRLAARIGASGITFGHMLPTSPGLDERLSLANEKRRMAEAEARKLREDLGIAVSFSASETTDTCVSCEPLAGQMVSIDCRGFVSLCCQLADYRGSTTNNEIVADLNTSTFGRAYASFLSVALLQRMRRRNALVAGEALAKNPCDFCINTMGKTEWRSQVEPVDTMAGA